MNSSDSKTQFKYISLDGESNHSQVEHNIFILQMAMVAVVAIGIICLAMIL